MIRKLGGGVLFLLVVVILYLVLAALDFETAQAGFTAFLRLLAGILPVLGIVFSLIFVSNLLLDSRTLVRYLGREAGKRGWLIAVVAGIISAGPIYLWFPLLSDLREKGMRPALIAVFLYNRAVKIPLLPVMILYFGLKTVVILTLYMVLFSLLNGFIVEHILRSRSKT
jgi:uncharacterized membrane protein YraQ (UPF0718 family)